MTEFIVSSPLHGDLKLSEEKQDPDENKPQGQGSSSAGSSIPSSPEATGKRYRPYKAVGDGEGCASCAFSISKEIAAQLPPGAPGSPKANGLGTNGSPILRSKTRYPVAGSPLSDSDAEDDPALHQSSPTSVTSSNTTTSSFHDHFFQSNATSDPVDPNTYALLRRACIQTLSCENLPRGCGQFSHQDPIHGLIIAERFRLPDPHARGRKRQYALLAVAGPDSPRGMEAATMIWSVFHDIVEKLEAKAEEVLKRGQCPAGANSSVNVSNIPSFLTARTVDPDGYPRRNGINTRARSLTEIVGNELIFSWVHKKFSMLLLAITNRFGEVSVES
ncbi:MAG: hypothetical protein Q9181_004848 [Wetmoreana brouardii]